LFFNLPKLKSFLEASDFKRHCVALIQETTMNTIPKTPISGFKGFQSDLVLAGADYNFDQSGEHVIPLFWQA
jgi:hypothetical protein